MKKCLPLIFACLLFSLQGISQVYVDQFDNDDAANVGGAATFTSSEGNDEWTITGANTGPWDVVTYSMHDQDSGTPMTVDATGNNKIYVRAKASSVGTQLRMDIQDADGYMTTNAGITKTLTTDYMVLEFDFSGGYSDGGFGGTACDAMNAPCPVDGSKAAQLVFYVEPGAGGFNGSIVIDYVAFGEEPGGIIMSDVFQDHMDGQSSADALTSDAAGWSVTQSGTEVTISGDGTLGPWDAFGYLLINHVTGDTVDVDATGNNKVFVKIKSTVANTIFRVDLQDIDGFATTTGSIQKIIPNANEYVILEYDFTGVYSDEGYGGTACTADTAPCPVDGTRIGNMVFFIEPGVGEFLGDVTIDYVSYGISLEPAGDGPELVYEDRFADATITGTTDAAGLAVEEDGENLVITGDGSAGAFSAIAYSLHDQDDASPIVLDMTPAKNKVIIKAKVSAGSVPIRMDVIDTSGYTTSFSSITKTVTDEFTVLEYDFSGATDGGYGGTPCEADNAPCPVDLTAINTVLIYPDPVAGAFDRVVTIDYLSVGKPLGDDPVDNGPKGEVNYSDQMDDNTNLFVTDVAGLVSSFAGNEWTITGDGSNGMWNSILYAAHNDTGEPIMANAVGSSDKLYIKAKSSVAGTEFRIDLQDKDSYVTNAASTSVNLTEDYVIYELNYAGKYNDGGFGGSPCTSDTAPCPVDGERIQNLQFFVLPGAGMFDGTISVEWISFGRSLDVGATGMINYVDEIDAVSGQFTEVPGGFTETITDTWVITGDGNGGAFDPMTYAFHNDAEEAIIISSSGSNDRMYVRAKATSSVDLRIDLQDMGGYFTNLNAVQNTIGSDEYEVYEYNYASSYQDGGFGGPCDPGSAPCPVDSERIQSLLLFANPGVGGYDGTIEIDWIAWGEPFSGITDLNRLNTLKAYPNPFNSTLQLEYDLVENADVQVAVYNMLGAKVQVQAAGRQAAGLNYEEMNLSQLPIGIYTLQITADGTQAGTLRVVKK